MTVSVVGSAQDVWYPSTVSGPRGSGYGPKIPVYGVGYSFLPGDLLIVTVGTSKVYDSVSTGWTLIVATGSGSTFVSSWWRIYDGSSNDDFTFYPSAVCSLAMGMIALRSTVGFDSSSIESTSHNTANSAGASYALSAGLSGVGTGELSIALGGNHGTTEYTSNNCNVSGAAWTLSADGGVSGAPGATGSGGCMTATCATTGSPAVPSVTYGRTTETFGKFIFAAVIKDGAAAAGGGLFWGMH